MVYMNAESYIKQRKNYLRKITKLFLEREKINKEIKGLRAEQAGWDRNLIENE